MIEIRFEETSDAKILYEQMKAKSFYIDMVLREQSIIVSLAADTQDFLVRELVEFIVRTKEMKWMDEILAQSFFYGDEEERNHILHIADELMRGSNAVWSHESKQDCYQLLHASLQDIIQADLSFSFASYVRFRLRVYFAELHRFVEMAIDEYKLEQEYQSFVEALRQQLGSRKSRLSCLHLVFHDSFVFYDDKGHRLNQERLVKYIDSNILKNQDLYVDANVIAPLLSIAPKTIHLYTAHADHNMVVTIRNVFQERVKLYTVGEFEKMRQNL
ncbi:putative sporulation protein YtxC [Ectobacillus sp. JY-23]|uniref:putative sporulation protein YtxC n=1 Tax=Ectobacillus sp. JY-23 TaxID=2933872 RepID=UPI001FF46A24|nr:putative sporulation protein YtxC [Ectobacillus sp. JY-23]UOY94262.1 putative sporulation protein YtxC [Ectobacillus sp. JY-23]